MSEKPLDKEGLRTEYDELRPKHQKLESSLKRDLEASLRDAGISVLKVESRVKDFDSLRDKVQRKHYDNPLQEIHDICGLRVICYYPSDVGRVSELIQSEFDVVELVDKADSLEPEEFGYRSLHITVTPNKHMLNTVSYRGLNDLKAEIQVRTILQHAWADLSHELDYKKEEYAPKQFHKTLYQLSAMLDNLDDQFDELRREKGQYTREVSEEAKRSGVFNADQELNIDTLQALLDFHLPDREQSRAGTGRLLDDLVESQMTMRDFVDRYERVKTVLASMEQELREATEDELEPMRFTGWAQAGVARAVLVLTDDEYWRTFKEDLSDDAQSKVVERWRSRLSMPH